MRARSASALACIWAIIALRSASACACICNHMQLCSSNAMQSSHSHCTLHLWHDPEHALHTGRPQGPPGLCAFPGHLFSAVGGQLGPGFQHPTRMEIVLMLREDCRDPDRAPDLGGLARPLSDLEPRLPDGDCPTAARGSDGCAAASSRSSRSTSSWYVGRSGATLSESSGMGGCLTAVPMAGL